MRNQIMLLFNYQWHTTRKLLDCATQLEPGIYTVHPGYGHGSIHDIFVHMLQTSVSWRTALEEGQQRPALDAASLPDYNSVSSAITLEEHAWRSYLGEQDDAFFNGDMRVTNRHGQTYSMPFWRIMQHLALHSMQHHSELAQLLSIHGCSPGNIDFIFYQG